MMGKSYRRKTAVKRVVIDYVGPQIDCGRFPVKRAVGEILVATAHVFADGHDHLRAELLYKRQDDGKWVARDMARQVNDEWTAAFEVKELSDYVYTVRAWVDAFETWQSDLRKKCEAGQDIKVDLEIGSALLRDAAKRAEDVDSEHLTKWAQNLSPL